MAEYIDKKAVISIINTAGFWEEEDREVAITCVEQTKAADVAPAKHGLHALRPVSREQVEKVWGLCKVCNGEMTLYQHTNTTKLYMDTFGKAATLVTECNACPPHADCCMKGISANSAFIINYCPECGRPLTDEAVQIVMERLEEQNG